MTTGRGKAAPTAQPNRPVKEVLGYPLVKDFRQRLAALAVSEVEPLAVSEAERLAA